MTNEQMTKRRGCAKWFVRDGRLRSGWRVTSYALVVRLAQFLLAVAIGIGLAVYFAQGLMAQGVATTELPNRVTAAAQDILNTPLFSLGYRVVDIGIVLALVWVFRRWVDRRPFRSLGFQLTAGWWREALAGFVLAIAMWGVIFALSLALGAVTVSGFAWERKDWLAIGGALIVGLLTHIMVGIAEETDSRGYVLQNLAEGIRFAPAAVISSVYFGALHLLNPGAGIFSTVGIFVAGVLLAMGYYATRRLWFSIGMHTAWNWVEGPILGFLVSGLNADSLLRLEVAGPEWLMGGAFGPEAGALAIAVEIAVIAALFVWARGMSRIRTNHTLIEVEGANVRN